MVVQFGVLMGFSEEYRNIETISLVDAAGQLSQLIEDEQKLLNAAAEFKKAIVMEWKPVELQDSESIDSTA